jgi:nicotinamidase-related amidase
VNTVPISHPKNLRALIIVDMQAGFLPERTRWIVPNVKQVIEEGEYNLYIEALFHAEPGSIWDKQTEWTFPLDHSIPEIAVALADKDPIVVIKETKSVFQGDVDLIKLFKEKGIEEVHIVGVDANDCVLATAFDSFDAGFFTYVVEEGVESSESAELREAALTIMRNVNLTNHSL